MVNSNSAVCSLHFIDSDYQVASKQKRRKNRRISDNLQLKKLLPDAIPSQFPDLPKYYSKSVPDRRSESTSRQARFQREYDAAELAHQNFLEADVVTSLEDLEERLKVEKDLSKDIQMLKGDNKLTLYSLAENDLGRPFVKYSLVVKEDLQFSMFCGEVKMPQSKVAHLCSKNAVKSFEGFLNILSNLRISSNENIAPPRDIIEHCFSLLNDAIPELEEEIAPKISFAAEQLKLALKSSRGRRYSPTLLTTCVLWKMTSPALYKQIDKEGVLSIPSPKYIDKLAKPFKPETGFPESTKKYLKARFVNLTDREKVVNLILDEVYCAHRVEYKGGTFYGYENSKVTKTLLCFMIKSVGGKYMDVVCMVPLDKIDANIIQTYWDCALKEVTEVGFDVVCDTLDGHSSNRKFYQELLCKGDLKLSIPHPYRKGSEIFLPFDSVHVFKCVYNNAVNKKQFKCPKWDGMEIGFDMRHIEELYKKEMGRPLKYAHKLNDKVLHPQPIEKTKVALADAFFHESTIDALDFYSKNGHPEWKGTANFFRIIRTWWNIVNVKNKYAAQRTRDPVRTVISLDPEHGDMGGIQWLTKFAKWLKEWHEMNDFKNALSKETFFTMRQTSEALVGLAIYLLEEKGFEYVPLGLISSDPLEKRFGWYRQLGGANYFLSVVQFLEAEKKIRLQSLVKFGDLTFKEASELLKPVDSSEDIEKEAKKLLELLGDFEIEFRINDEEGILFYIAGFLACSEIKTLSCESCTDLMAKSKNAPNIDFEGADFDVELGDRKAEFLDQINRGGLCTPTDMMYILALCARALRKKIFDEGEIQKHFLNLKNERAVFTACFVLKLQNDETTAAILEQKCENSHPFSEHINSIGHRIFNTMSKNFVGEIKSKIHEGRKRKQKNPKESSAAKKINKLKGGDAGSF